MTSPALPVNAWPEGISFAPSGRAWFFPDQEVVLTQTLAPEVTAEDAHALIDFFLWLTSSSAPPPTAIVVHDWRSLTKLSREARSAFISRRAEIKVRPARIYVAVRLNPVYRMALQTAMLGAQMVTRAVATELVDDPFEVLKRLRAFNPDLAVNDRLRRSWDQTRTRRNQVP